MCVNKLQWGICACVLVLSFSAIAQPVEQPKPSLENAPNGWSLNWEGVSGRTYFVQWSNDLKNWNYYPVIKSGTGVPAGYGLNIDNDQVFLRLKYSDIPTNDAYLADFDDD